MSVQRDTMTFLERIKLTIMLATFPVHGAFDIQDNCPCPPCTKLAGGTTVDGDPDMDFLPIPGPNGTTVNMTFGSVLDRVLDHSNYTDAPECITLGSSSPTATPHVDEQSRSNSTDHYGRTDVTATSLVPERANTSDNEGGIYKEVTNTYITPTTPNERAPPTHHFEIPVRAAISSGANGSKTAHPGLLRVHGAVPVIDAKFQISGLHLGNVAPLRARPLLTEAHIASHDFADILRNTTNILRNLRTEEDVDNWTLLKFAHTVNNVVDNIHIQSGPDVVKEDLLIDIMRVGEELMTSIVTVDEPIDISTDALGIVSKLIDGKDIGNDRITVKSPTNSSTDEITLASSLLRERKAVRVSAVTYRKLGSLHSRTTRSLGSAVTSVTVHDVDVSGPPLPSRAPPAARDAIILMLDTAIDKDRVEDRRTCTYWDFATRAWSTKGCRLVSRTDRRTVCSCNHLTTFAVLVMYIDNGDQVGIGNQQALFTLTTVGCSLSIACLAMTLIAFVYLRMLRNEKVLIHANLSLALMLAQLVFVSSNDAYKHQTACKVVAVLLHFLFLASFTWMLVEGINLYLCCTHGLFNTKDNRVKYCVLGWGLPALIVVISFAVGFPGYGVGPQFSCWLSVHTGLIWAFVGPMLAIVMLNVLVMVLVVKAFLTLKTNSQKTDVARLRSSLRAVLTLLPLLGSGWVLSLLVPVAAVFHYLFVIVNTVQWELVLSSTTQQKGCASFSCIAYAMMRCARSSGHGDGGGRPGGLHQTWTPTTWLAAKPGVSRQKL